MKSSNDCWWLPYDGGCEAADDRDAAAFVVALKQRGVLAGWIGERAVRLVTHYDAGRDDCMLAAAAIGVYWRSGREAD
jgi:hypothetical protein